MAFFGLEGIPRDEYFTRPCARPLVRRDPVEPVPAFYRPGVIDNNPAVDNISRHTRQHHPFRKVPGPLDGEVVLVGFLERMPVVITKAKAESPATEILKGLDALGNQDPKRCASALYAADTVAHQHGVNTPDTSVRRRQRE